MLLNIVYFNCFGEREVIRKRRALIFDDEPIVLEMLEKFLGMRGYEVFAFSEPVVCPVFRNNERHCHNNKPCADVMITDYKMPAMNGFEMLELQRARGCNLDVRNKAVISGFLDEGEVERLMLQGYAFFKKPFHLVELSDWLSACEERIPLAVPVGIPRKEFRKPVCININYSLPSWNCSLDGVVTNLSGSGFCLTTDRYIPEHEHILLNSDLPVACRAAEVRWSRQIGDRAFVSGFDCA